MDQKECFSLQRFATPDNSERIARLRQCTDDADILAHVDHVAFDQEDLVRLLQPVCDSSHHQQKLRWHRGSGGVNGWGSSAVSSLLGNPVHELQVLRKLFESC